MGLVYGIDFGTSNSAIMVGLPDGRVRRVLNPVDSVYDVPSVVCMRPDDSIAVGSVAWRMRLTRPNWYREEFKRDIGSSIPAIFPPENVGGLTGGRIFGVNYLVAQVLRLLREQAERKFPGDVDLVVITVPASWEAGNRRQMLDAAGIAGFDTSRVHLVKEPEAAVAYAVQEHLGLQPRTLLVYDLGGGTFDCALVRGSKSSGYQVLGESGGLDNVGGVLFNREILGLIRNRFPQEMAQLFNGSGDDIRVLQRRLQIRDTCENAKRVLSTEYRFEGALPELAQDAEFILTRAEFAELISPMLADTITECERLLRSLGKDWDGIDMVIPVGGSSRLPVVGETIARYSGKRHASVMRVEDPELAVVHGATLRALELARSPAIGHVRGYAISPGTVREQPTPLAPPVAHPLAPPLTARLEPVPESVASEPPPPEPDRRQRPADLGARFPETGVTFRARQDRGMQRVWRWHRRTATITFLAAGLAIVNFFDIPGSTKPGHGITQGELTIAAYVLVAVSIAGFLMTSTVLNNALKKWGEMATTGISIGCAAAVHYFVHGWLGWVLVSLSLLIAYGAWAATTEDIPSKMKFVRSLAISSSGLVLMFSDYREFSFQWDEIESITNKSNSVIAVLRHDRWRARKDSHRLSYTQSDHSVALFERYQFAPERDIFAAIDFYSGTGLTQDPR